MMYLGIAGAQGSGKDTLAGMLAGKIPNGVVTGFAEKLKRIAMDVFGLSYEECYTQEGKERFNEFWGMTNREILQKLGTEAMRNGFRQDIWVKFVEKKFLDNPDKSFVVCDVRFNDEAEFVLSQGGVIVRVIRDEAKSNLTEEQKGHASEKGIDDKYVYKVIENNGSLENLENEAMRFLAEYQGKFQQTQEQLNKLKELPDGWLPMGGRGKRFNGKHLDMFMNYAKMYFNAEVGFGNCYPITDNDLYFEWSPINGIKTSLDVYLKDGVMDFSGAKSGKKETFHTDLSFKHKEDWDRMNEWFSKNYKK